MSTARLSCEPLERRDNPFVWSMPGWTAGNDVLLLRAADVPAGTTEIRVTMQSGNDTLRLESAPAGVPVVVYGGFGDDQVSVGGLMVGGLWDMTRGDLARVNTAVSFFGEEGTNTAGIYDSLAAGGGTYTVSSEGVKVSRLPGFDFRYLTVSHLSLNMSNFDDVLNQIGRPPGGWSHVLGGNGNDRFRIVPTGGRIEDLFGIGYHGGNGTDTLVVDGRGEVRAVEYTANYATRSTAPVGYEVNAWAIIGGVYRMSTTATSVENAEILGGPADDRISVSMTPDPMKEFPISNFLADGGGGNDTLAGLNVDNTFRLTGANSGTLTSAGLRGGTTFTSVENIWAGYFRDTLYVSAAGRLSGTFDGAGGADRILGPDSANTWTLTGNNAGNLNGAVAFVNTESVYGGTMSDLFRLAADFVRLSGTLDGGLGTDTLDARLIAPTLPAIGTILGIEIRL